MDVHTGLTKCQVPGKTPLLVSPREHVPHPSCTRTNANILFCVLG